jgi:hypothetical protein
VGGRDRGDEEDGGGEEGGEVGEKSRTLGDSATGGGELGELGGSEAGVEETEPGLRESGLLSANWVEEGWEDSGLGA